MNLTWPDWVLLIVGILLPLPHVHKWWAALCLYSKRAERRKPSELAWMMLRYTWFGRNRRHLVFGVLLGIWLAAVLIYRSVPWPFAPFLTSFWPFALLVTSLCSLPFLSFSVPPAIIFLGTSDEQTVSLMRNIYWAISPLRVVALLDFPWWLGIIRYDNLRTRNDPTWRAVVWGLMDTVPLVVVDTRVASPAVVEEVIRMLNPVRQGKALFVSDMLGRCPAVDVALASGFCSEVGPDEPEHGVPIVPITIAASSLRRILMQFIFPDNDPPWWIWF
jgi:hypothetical protein